MLKYLYRHNPKASVHKPIHIQLQLSSLCRQLRQTSLTETHPLYLASYQLLACHCSALGCESISDSQPLHMQEFHLSHFSIVNWHCTACKCCFSPLSKIICHIAIAAHAVPSASLPVCRHYYACICAQLQLCVQDSQ